MSILNRKVPAETQKKKVKEMILKEEIIEWAAFMKERERERKREEEEERRGR